MLDDYPKRIADGQVWVLADGAVIDGILVLEETPDGFLLDNIAVAPNRQGKGVGRALLAFAEAEAVRRGWREIRLYTNALMTENIALYRTHRVRRDRARERERLRSRLHGQTHWPGRSKRDDVLPSGSPAMTKEAACGPRSIAHVRLRTTS